LAGHGLAEPGGAPDAAWQCQLPRLVGKPAHRGAARKWLEAATVQEQQAICAEIQRISFEEVPYYPLGQYKQPTAYRKAITGIGRGTATFWNVRPA
jgi:ABC-type transport system substrate-binding protein